MNYTIEILRQKNPDSAPYRQTLSYTTDDKEMTVATLLKTLNADPDLSDIDGEPVRRIEWECSCLQKKCGACAMRINGKPRLACDTKLGEFKDGKVTLEPFKKFPVVADLIVDRSVMFRNLKNIGLWLEKEARHPKKGEDVAYEASRCLQCGCCLEVCPNFFAGGSFTGMASAIPFSRLLAELPVSQRKEAAKLYTGRFYNGCGKSLACRNICPAGIDVDDLLVNSNAIAVWKRFGKP